MSAAIIVNFPIPPRVCRTYCVGSKPVRFQLQISNLNTWISVLNCLSCPWNFNSATSNSVSIKSNWIQSSEFIKSSIFLMFHTICIILILSGINWTWDSIWSPLFFWGGIRFCLPIVCTDDLTCFLWSPFEYKNRCKFIRNYRYGRSIYRCTWLE